MHRIAYRPDIDGLRAIAVLAVLAFHADIGLAGGFVGVDIFFVISGFLITSLILRDLDAGRFSLADFWERRIRRIAPPMIALLISVIAVGYLVFLPKDLESVGKAACAQIAMAGNIYAWRDTGYFAASSKIKPLLHVWSLAIEEQFYLLFPFALTLTSRLTRPRLFVCFLIITAASFILCVLGTAWRPVATFLLLPTRMWELLLGSIVAFGRPVRLPWQTAAWLSWLGLVGIVGSILFIRENQGFPGPLALIPTASAALFILGNQTALSLPGRVLASPWFVRIGLISYGLYLWHWPVLVFMNYVAADRAPLILRLVGVGITFLAAGASVTHVENPVRRRLVLRSRSSLFATFLAVSVVVSALAAGAWASRGAPWRLGSSMQCEGSPYSIGRIGAEGLADDDNPASGATFVLWGDSHAGQLYSLFDDVGRRHHLAGWAVPKGGCPPIPGVCNEWHLNLPRWTEQIVKQIEENQITHVFLAARWSLYIEGWPAWVSHDGAGPLIFTPDGEARTRDRAYALLREQLKSLCDRLLRAGCTVYIIAQPPDLDLDPVRSAFVTRRTCNLIPELCPQVTRADYANRQARVNEVFETLRSKRVRILDGSNIFFDERGMAVVSSDEKLLFSDNNHLTLFGAEAMLSRMLENVFVEIVSEKR